MSDGNEEKMSTLEMLKRSILELNNVNDKLSRLKRKVNEPIAIIGMGCRLPGHSKTPEAFWELLKNGVDGISDIPAERFDIDDYYDQDPGKLNKIITKKGAFLDGVDLFDPSFFGISPIEAEVMDPQQRLLLHVTWEALEYAGIAPESLKNSMTGVFIGVSSNEYGALISKNTRDFSSHFASGNALNALSGRISYCFGLQGPSLIVDTACSSSLVSLHTACKSLLSDDCKLAIAGGVNIILDPASFVSLSSGQMLSPDGHCKTFDSSADGYARGEGIGVLVLKRLSEAKRDGDRILAIIRGSAVNQDGPSSGLTVPNGVAQATLIRKALESAKLNPLDISFVEAHGTGTSLGDPIEVDAISEVYGESRSAESPLLIGSVKSNIGHLESAAGMSSLIKVILALNHKQIPGNLHFHHLNPKIDLKSIHAKIVTECTPWNVKEGQKRIAGISGFGFTGTNAHIILEEAPTVEEKKSTREDRSLHLLILSAKSQNALNHLVKEYQDFLENTVEKLEDIVYTAATGRNHELFRLAIVAKDLEELKLKLKNGEFSEGEIKSNKKFKIQFHYQDSGDYQIHKSTDDTIKIDIGPHPNWGAILAELSAYYVVGAEVDWKGFEFPFNRQKIILPHYPFEYQHIWSDLAVVRKPGLKILSNRHPFLARKLITPGIKDIVYESTIDFNWPDFVSDHLIYGLPVIAGAGYISALLSATDELSENGSGTISELEWIRPLVFKKSEVSTLQIILHPLDVKNDYRFEVISCKHLEEEALDSEWLTHAVGQLKLNTEYEKLPKPESIENIQSRLKTHYDAAFLYGEVTPKISLGLGPHFRWIEEVWVSSTEILIKMRLPQSLSETKSYILYPGFIDSVFQGGMAYMPLANKFDILSIPLFLEEAWYDKDKGYPRWVHSQRRIENGQEIADFLLLNEFGVGVGRFKGFRVKAVPREALLRAQGFDVNSLLYEWVWKEHSFTHINTKSQRNWLVLGSGAIVEKITALLKEQGDTCECLSLENIPKSKEEFLFYLRKVSKEKPINGILHAASTEVLETLSGENVVTAQSLGVESLLHLIQAIVSENEVLNIAIFLITREITSFHGSRNLPQTPLNGFFKTLVAERPDLQIKHIDVNSKFNTSLFIQALFSTDSESEFTLNETGCYVPRFLRLRAAREMRNETLDPLSSLEEKISLDATYLVTGALGGIGLTLAKWLAEKNAGHLVLTGRRTLSEENKVALKNLETENTQISYEVVDIGDEKSVMDLLCRLQESQKPLKGIFHLAGLLDDATLMAQDWTHFEKVFRPKVYGAFYLHQYSKNLNFFVMFSSMSSSLGNPGQINYASANSFMDGLADYRRNHNLPAQSLSWGPWAEVGMAKTLIAQSTRNGILGIQPKEGMLALESALISPEAHITIANINWKNYINHIIEPPKWFEGFITQKTSKANFSTQVASMPPENRFSAVKKYVSDAAKEIFGIPPSQFIDENKGFFDMGLDSLMAVELKNRLQTGLGKEAILPATSVFDYGNIEKMSHYISKLLKIDTLKIKKPQESIIVGKPEEPIAIIGIGCRFPAGANNPEEFWHFLENARDGISQVPKDRFDIEEYYDPVKGASGKTYVRTGGFLNVPIDLFDADFFGISHREAEDLDPQQRLLLEVTWEALENAFIPPQSLRESTTGIYIGFMTSDYSELISAAKGLNGITPYFGSGNSNSGAVGRLSYVLGLQGPCLAIETACSSSLVAINSACESLRLGQCQLAIAGGVNLILGPNMYVVESQLQMLSPDGHCKTFDKSADGFGRAEGCGILVLKRLSEAQRDGDKIYALIKGSSVNHNGASSGLTVPNGDAQEKLIRNVCLQAGIKPSDIDYIEAHGTGTSLGDPIEVRAIADTYGQRDNDLPLFMGSVKSNFGHAEGAAGVAGVIKTVLSLNHEALPINLNFQELNPHIDINFPVKILTEKMPWKKGDRIRRAGVSSFGFSGVNAHVIVEEAPETELIVSETEERPLHILTLSAKTEPALNALMQNYQHFLDTTEASLADICYSANAGRNHELYRIAVIAKDVAELKTKLSTSEFTRGKSQKSKVYEFSATGDWAKDLNELAIAYTNGAVVDWKKFDAIYVRNKVLLPTYPFQRKRYWFDFISSSFANKKFDLFYQTDWIQDFSPTISITDPRKIAVLSINSNASVLTKVFENNGSCEVIINHSLPSNKFEILTLLENFNSQNSLTDIIVDATLLKEVCSIEESLVKLLYIIQSVLDIFKNASPRLYFITSSDPLVFEAVRSMQLCVLQEQPTLLLTHVGMDISENEWRLEALKSALFQKREDTSILFRGNHLYVPRFVRVKEEVEKVVLNISPAGIYLVTGGMGAIGLEVVKFLLQEGAGGVVISGRSVLDEAIQKRIDTINFPAQKIQYVQMDVSDFDSVKSGFKNIQDTMGDLKGIFHLAGVLKDDLLLNQTSENFSLVLAPKLIGSYNLHQASENCALDYFVLFSSLASTLGSPGQINYAAANGFMNGLALSRRAKGLPATSIAWGPWEDAGMASELTQRLAQQGVGAISAKDGMKYLKVALMRNETLVACSPIYWDRYFSQYLQTPIWLSAFFGEKKSKVDIYAQLRSGDHENNLKILYPFIGETIASAIVLSDSQLVDPNKNFYDMGMDSLMMMSVSNQLRAALNNHPDISPALLIENPSIHQLSLALESHLKMGGTPLLKPHIPNTIEIINSSAWITELSANKKPDLRIFCFAHAGGGKSLFLNWRSQLPDSISLCLLQLPGREDRLHESVPLTPVQIISSIVSHMMPYLDLPYVLVGHSFGALLCYDVMLELKRLSLPMPLHAFLSSYNPDRQDASQYIEGLLNLSEDEFFKEVQDRFQGLPPSILEDKKLKTLIFPALKADFAYMAHHPSLQKKILDVSISTLSGDTEKITPEEMAIWKEYTTGAYEHQTLVGGHFMISDNQKEYLEFLLSRIKKL